MGLELVEELAEAHVLAMKHAPQVRKISFPDPRARVRFRFALEGLLGAVYGLTEVAANFLQRLEGSPYPGSFNKLRKKIEAGTLPALAEEIGDAAV